MRRACSLLMVLFASFVCFGQSAPKLTSPRIVAAFERLGQTAAIPPTTIYTPKKWGTFRVSVIMILTKGNNGNGGDWQGQFLFVDGAGVFTGEPSIFAGTKNRAVWETPFRCKPGQRMVFSVTPGGNTAGSKYNALVVVEQLM